MSGASKAGGFGGFVEAGMGNGDSGAAISGEDSGVAATAATSSSGELVLANLLQGEDLLALVNP
jgi:hypothetical protein